MDTPPDRSSPVHDTSTSSLTIDVDALYEELNIIKSADRTRHEFVEKLIHHIQSLNREQEVTTKMLRSKEILAVTYQEKYEAAEKTRNELQRSIDCDLFVLVLIDGDNTLFEDEYIKDGLQGGERAARDLQQALFDYVKDKQYFKHDYGIVTRIYVNFAGLSKTYSGTKIIPDAATFEYFVRGFNKTHDLAKIVDAGDGKQGADRMVKAEFDLFRRNQHCRQIMLAVAGDNGYGGLLRPYAPNLGKSNKITLIEALPFVRDIQLISDKFESTSFNGIFRKTKIPTRRVSFQEDKSKVQTPSTAASTETTASDPAVTPITSPTTYAAKVHSVDAAQMNSSNGTSTASLEEWKLAPSSKSSRPIYLNEVDQRIDLPIKGLNKDRAYWTKQQKFCNKHHLSKNCSLGDKFCNFRHGPALDAEGLDHLRSVARLSPCVNGLWCRSPDCIDGHRCPRGVRCAEWNMGQCRFSKEMHEVIMDPKHVKTVMVKP